MLTFLLSLAFLALYVAPSLATTLLAKLSLTLEDEALKALPVLCLVIAFAGFVSCVGFPAATVIALLAFASNLKNKK